jgi:putative hydrolase of the HAD superfamily
VHPLLKTVRAVVFDAVGTVIHPEPPAPQVYAEVGSQFGSRRPPPEITPRFAAAFAREEARDREFGFRTDETREVRRWREIVASVLDDVVDPEGCFQELFAHFARPKAWSCDPAAAMTFEALARQGYILGLASNYDRRLRTVAAGLPALAPLTHLVISSEVGWRKPAPQFFAALSRSLELSAEMILFVGDDPANDLEGAQAAGLPALLLDRKRSLTLAPKQQITSLADLLKVSP